jgi:hypothetical protein
MTSAIDARQLPTFTSISPPPSRNFALISVIPASCSAFAFA